MKEYLASFFRRFGWEMIYQNFHLVYVCATGTFLNQQVLVFHKVLDFIFNNYIHLTTEWKTEPVNINTEEDKFSHESSRRNHI